jgi:bacteriocin biosynthesis cyclodehydratase domain-containing protein
VRPHLRPGLRVLRRDVRSVQLGLDWPGVVVLPDTPALRAVLTAIDGIRDVTAVVLTAAAQPGVDEAASRGALDALIDCGAVIDLPHHLRGTLSEPAWASDWLLSGPERRATDLMAARSGHCVEVRGTGQVADRVRELADRFGLRIDTAKADVVIVASDHEPSRDVSDQMMADGRPHLWALVRELVGVLGPFVEPGTTPCQRCVDRARTDRDPAWPTLVESSAVRRGQVHACDPLLATLVATWAVQEVLVWAADLRAQTWGRVIEIPLGLGTVETTPYLAHPACGCGWSSWQDTMGA